MNTIHCGSSLRAVPVAVTLKHAIEMGTRLGITRVTDTTWLDQIGIPVFASIRPNALPGSLCVNAGKGLTPEEAKASAWMEAIEFAMTEPGRVPISMIEATGRDVLDGVVRPEAILDLCPIIHAKIPLQAPMFCVEAEEIISGKPVLIPAELVFFPAPVEVATTYFGASTNGLASGNTLLEATVHGLAEVIERDISSFRRIYDQSYLVRPETYPPLAQSLLDKIAHAGLRLWTRYQPNAFGIPYFDATLYDPHEGSLLYLNGGSGCHPHREIALVRAITEAAQSRLSMIHGGRDDLIYEFDRCEKMTSDDQQTQISRLLKRAQNPERIIAYDEIVDLSVKTQDIASCFDWIVSTLRSQGIHKICRVVFTQPTERLHVVKVVVPMLEDFDCRPLRVGKRLRDHAIKLLSI